MRSLSRVQLFATPWIAAYQAPLSMGFSRQECWSGVPMLCLVTWSCLTLRPDGLGPARLLSPGNNTGAGFHSLLQGNLPHPGLEPGSPALQVDSLRSEPPGKPKNTGAGSLTLLQGIWRMEPEKMATHSSILAWKIPWTEEPGRLQPMGLQELDTT